MELKKFENYIEREPTDAEIEEQAREEIKQDELYHNIIEDVGSSPEDTLNILVYLYERGILDPFKVY